jgi:hypothetical protein
MYTTGPAAASAMRKSPESPGKGEATGMSSTVVTVGVSGGLAVAGLVKLTLQYGWRRITAPKGRHRHG